MAFTLGCGTNISEWLSQSQRRGAERAAFFGEEDVTTIARLGFDHIRLPVDEEQLWDEHGARDPEAFKLLNAALDWCEDAGLRAVVDLHILRTHYFNQEETPRLFTDPAETQRFAGLWRDLSACMASRPVDMVAYELLNEPVARDPRDWNRVALAGLAAIREREPERVVVLGSNWFNQTHTFDMLEVPKGENILLTFHYYRPMPLTHYTAPWWGGGAYTGPVHYPGPCVTRRDLLQFPEDLRIILEQEDALDNWGPERIERDFQMPVLVARRNGYPLYCGEWGVYQKAPEGPRLAWYRDMVRLFDKYHIAYANWDYKGGFAPVVRDGRPSEIAGLLVQF
jgi:endoglucanase